MNGKYPTYDDRAIPTGNHEGKFGTYSGNGVCQNIALCNIDISLRRIADSQEVMAAIRNENVCKHNHECDSLRELVSVRDRTIDELKRENATLKAKLENDRVFFVGDVIAYRSLDENKPEWICWEVERIDEDGYLHGGDGDNIHCGSAFLVKAVEDKR